MSGTGALNLTSASNSDTGLFTINSGTVQISTDAQLGAANSSGSYAGVNLAGGALEVTQNLASAAGRSFSTNGGAIQVDPNVTFTLAGTISGSAALTETGAGTLNPTGYESENGVVVAGGTLLVTCNGPNGNPGLPWNNSTVTLDAGTTLNLHGTAATDTAWGWQPQYNTLVVNGNATINVQNQWAGFWQMELGSATLTVTGNQTLWLGGQIQVASYDEFAGSGTIAPAAGEQVVLGGSFVGSQVTIGGQGTVVGASAALSLVNGFNLNVLAGATYYVQNAANLGVNPNVVDNGTFILQAPQTFGTLSGTGTVNLNANPLTITGSSPNFAGQIEDTANSAASTLTFAGFLSVPAGITDNYSGPTTFSGTFQVNGALTASPVTVNTGGTLDGLGNISKTVSIAAGGTIQPGPVGPGSTGVLNTGAATLAGSYNVLLGGATPGLYDQLNVTGTATLGGNLNLSTLNNFAPTPGEQFVVIQTTGGVSGQFARANGQTIRNNSITVGSVTYGITYNVVNATFHDVILTVQNVVPAVSFAISATPIPTGAEFRHRRRRQRRHRHRRSPQCQRHLHLGLHRHLHADQQRSAIFAGVPLEPDQRLWHLHGNPVHGRQPGVHGHRQRDLG